MNAQDNKQWVQQMFEEYNAIRGDAAKAKAWVDRSYAPDSTTHAPISGDMNFEQEKQYHVAQVSALSPHYAVQNLIAEGDMVVAQFTVQCSHQGAFMGMPPTGRKIEVDGTMIIKVAAKKMQEIWLSMDTLGFMRQLGAVPAATK